MKLVAFGDSFVEGTIKLPTENSHTERQQINFVRQLSNQSALFDSIENFAVSGAGNKMIANDVYNFLQHTEKSKLKDCFLLICWTTPYRQDVYCNDLERYFPANKLSKHENYDFLTAQLITGTYKLCKLYDVKFLMTNSFAFVQRHNPVLNHQYIRQLSNYIHADKPNNTLFDIILERYCTDDNEYKVQDVEKLYTTNLTRIFRTIISQTPKDKLSKYVTPCYHPSEEGHQLIAETLLPIIKNYILSSKTA